MLSIKLIAVSIVLIVATIITIIITRSNSMILLPNIPSFRSISTNNDNDKQNIITTPENKRSLSSSSLSPPNLSTTHIDTPYVKEFYMPNGTWPNGILVAKDGIVWTVGTKSHTLI